MGRDLHPPAMRFPDLPRKGSNRLLAFHGVVLTKDEVGQLGPAAVIPECSEARASSKCCKPTSAFAANEPGLGSSADGKGQNGIDCSLERAGTPLHLSE